MSGFPLGHQIKPLVSQESQVATPSRSIESTLRGGRRAVTAVSLPAVPLLIVEV